MFIHTFVCDYEGGVCRKQWIVTSYSRTVSTQRNAAGIQIFCGRPFSRKTSKINKPELKIVNSENDLVNKSP